jgi:hypothetical protein
VTFFIIIPLRILFKRRKLELLNLTRFFAFKFRNEYGLLSYWYDWHFVLNNHWEACASIQPNRLVLYCMLRARQCKLLHRLDHRIKWKLHKYEFFYINKHELWWQRSRLHKISSLTYDSWYVVRSMISVMILSHCNKLSSHSKSIEPFSAWLVIQWLHAFTRFCESD